MQAPKCSGSLKWPSESKQWLSRPSNAAAGSRSVKEMSKGTGPSRHPYRCLTSVASPPVRASDRDLISYVGTRATIVQARRCERCCDGRCAPPSPPPRTPSNIAAAQKRTFRPSCACSTEARPCLSSLLSTAWLAACLPACMRRHELAPHDTRPSIDMPSEREPSYLTRCDPACPQFIRLESCARARASRVRVCASALSARAG